MWESIGAGFFASIVFLFAASFLGGLIPGGNGSEGVLFAGVVLLCGVIVTCTHIIVTKLNTLSGKNKEETKENDNEH